MKKLASIALIAAGALVAEQAVLRIKAIWWTRWYALESAAVTDGLGRGLSPTPKFAGALLGRHAVWNRDMLLVDISYIVVTVLCAYLLVRFGVLLFEICVLKERT